MEDFWDTSRGIHSLKVVLFYIFSLALSLPHSLPPPYFVYFIFIFYISYYFKNVSLIIHILSPISCFNLFNYISLEKILAMQQYFNLLNIKQIKLYKNCPFANESFNNVDYFFVYFWSKSNQRALFRFIIEISLECFCEF